MRVLVAILAAVALVLGPLTAVAQVSPGTELSGTITQSLSSASTAVGTPFTLSNVSSADGSGHVTAATISGHVTNVVKAGQGRPGRIDLGFDSIRLHNGTRYAIEARATELKVDTKSNAAKEIAGGLAGMIVGNIVGKWIGISFLGAAGAAGGYLVAKNNRQNITVPQNSIVTVQILRSRRQA
ncbi:MAG TPA: hypothetical protein VMA36_02645 [Candidatus Limnocylindria bacterium]|nr:hypothetical protein [Candidatus Limnocylindria bacterium]